MRLLLPPWNSFQNIWKLHQLFYFYQLERYVMAGGDPQDPPNEQLIIDVPGPIRSNLFYIFDLTFVCNGCGVKTDTVNSLDLSIHHTRPFHNFTVNRLDYCRRIESVVFGLTLFAVTLVRVLLMIAICGILQPFYFNPSSPINIRISDQPPHQSFFTNTYYHFCSLGNVY